MLEKANETQALFEDMRAKYRQVLPTLGEAFCSPILYTLTRLLQHQTRSKVLLLTLTDPLCALSPFPSVL